MVYSSTALPQVDRYAVRCITVRESIFHSMHNRITWTDTLYNDTSRRPEKFHPLQVIRLIDKREPKATALVFKTGKVVVTGAHSNRAVDYACAKFAAILGKLGNDTSRFK